MLIAHISDSHITQDGPTRSERIRDLERCVETINALDPLPDLVLHGGDVAQDGLPEEYAIARSILDRLRSPLTVLPGNRDKREPLKEAFLDCLPGLAPGPFIQFAQDLGELVLIGLDTLSDGPREGDMCDDRMTWLRGTLDAHADRTVLLAMHHTPWEVVESKFPFQFIQWERVAEIGEAIAAHGAVCHVLCGHVHRPVCGTVGGAPASAVPSIAADLRMGDYPEGQESKALYQIFEFTPVTGDASRTAVAA